MIVLNLERLAGSGRKGWRFPCISIAYLVLAALWSIGVLTGDLCNGGPHVGTNRELESGIIAFHNLEQSAAPQHMVVSPWDLAWTLDP